MTKKYQVRIEPEAYYQIINSISFIKTVSIKAASKLFQIILESINSLSEFPERFPITERYKLFGSSERQMTIVKGRYSILYVIEGDDVYFEYFVDSRKK